MVRWSAGTSGIAAAAMVALLAGVGTVAQTVRAPLPVVEVYKTPG